MSEGRPLWEVMAEYEASTITCPNCEEKDMDMYTYVCKACGYKEDR